MMNWHDAVSATNWLAANLASKHPQGPWPLGGWQSLGDTQENRPELRRRIELLLDEPSIAGSELMGLLRSFVAGLEILASGHTAGAERELTPVTDDDVPEDALDEPPVVVEEEIVPAADEELPPVIAPASRRGR